MNKFDLIHDLKKLYNKGHNILETLKEKNADFNEVSSIMISYDFQAGTYTELAKENFVYLDKFTDALANVFLKLGNYSSIMEVGVGEATVLNSLIRKLDPKNSLNTFGFDISWSRARYALKNSHDQGNLVNIFVADLFEIPLPDSSIDIVYTSHSLEPNGGREKDALLELYRVAKKYVVLLEPDFSNASNEAKERMISHGYVRNLPIHANELGMKVIQSSSFDLSINPLNPTGITIIRKDDVGADGAFDYVCPLTKSKLQKVKNVYFGANCGLIYPIISDIPCLLGSCAVLGTHFDKFE